MKDYRLSEIKAICKHRKAKFSRPCDDCEYVEFCGIIDAYNGMPTDIVDRLNIESRDMIDLPCINIATVMDKVKLYEVHYRDKKTNAILTKTCKTEAEADEFIAKLKENKQ